MLWLQHDHFTFDRIWEHVDFQLLATYDVVAAPNWRIEMAAQPGTELWLVREGQCELTLGTKRTVAMAGDVVLLMPGEFRDTFNNSQAPLSIIGFSCRATLLGVIDFLKLLDLPLSLPTPSARLSTLLEELVEESRARHFGYTLAAPGLAQLALVEVLRSVETRNAEQQESVRRRLDERLRAAQSTDIAAALRFITEEYAEPGMNVADMAAAAHLSPKHFSRKFKAALDLAPMEYLRRLRLRRAQDLLAASDATVGQVAAKCGFYDPAHFSRAFKAAQGLSPVAFRRYTRSLSARDAHSRPSP